MAFDLVIRPSIVVNCVPALAWVEFRLLDQNCLVGKIDDTGSITFAHVASVGVSSHLMSTPDPSQLSAPQWSMAKRRNWTEIHDEIDGPSNSTGWVLTFQRVTYHFKEQTSERGLRFMYRRPGDGNLATSRGQARIPSLAAMDALVSVARERGWGDWVGPD